MVPSTQPESRSKVVGGVVVVAVLLLIGHSININDSFNSVSTRHHAAACTHFLKTGTVGGAGNQRECIINAVLVAYSTGLCLVQPNTWAIFHADLERGVKGRTDYMPPFNDRSSWNNFDTMFEPTAFRQAMAKLGVVVVDSDNAALKGSNIEWGDFTVQMGELTTATNGTAQQQLKRRYNRQWAKLNGVRTVFKYDSCYSGFGVSRGDSDLCLAFGADVCHTATASLQPSAFIVAESDRALSLLRHNYPECKVWHAVHMRAFGCQPTTNIIAGAANTIGPAASHKAEALQSWCLYVISEADPEVTKAAFKPMYVTNSNYEVTSVLKSMLKALLQRMS